MENVTFSDSEGNRLSGILSVPKQAYGVVILTHGFSSNKNSRLYAELEKELNKEGLGTFRYDYYGHGSLYGHKVGYGVSKDVTLSKSLESLRAAITFLRSKGQLSFALVGSSFGGLISLIVASEEPGIKSLVLKSPVTEPLEFWKQRLGNERLREWKEKGTMHYHLGVEDYDLDYGFWKDLLAYKTLESAKKITCPVLILHGDKDTYVPIKQSYDLAKVLGCKVRVVQGADHAYSDPGHYAKMKQEIIDFLKLTLKPA